MNNNGHVFFRTTVTALLVLLLVFICAVSFGESTSGTGATSGTCGTNLTWELSDGKLTISGTGTMDNYTESSAAPWEEIKNQITEVEINYGVTTIGNYAFWNCSNMTAISLPMTIQTIGYASFCNCGELQDITLGNSVTSLGDFAFSNCVQLESVLFPSNLRRIGGSCFFNSGLKTVTIPHPLSIGDHAFSGCERLTKIVFPDDQTKIPRSVASWCNNLKEVIIGEGTEEIEELAFNGLGLTTVTIPSTLTYVENSVFGSCSGLSDVYYTGTKAMAKTITVELGNEYFATAAWHCSDGNLDGLGITSGICGTNLTWEWARDDTLVISGTGPMKNYNEQNRPSWETVGFAGVVINSGATTIGDYAFFRRGGSSNISLPDTIQTIGHSAFRGCSYLPGITLGSNVTSLGDYAFAGCGELQSIIFPPSLTSIGESCFYSSGLISVTIPNTVTSVGDNTFSECAHLTKIVFPDNLTVIPCSVAMWCERLDEVVIGEGTEGIAESAFEGSELTTITIPSTLTQVESSAFKNCGGLSDVYYAGTKEMANRIAIGTDNEYFSKATWHCSDGDLDGLGETSGTCGTNLAWELADGTLTISGTGAMDNYNESSKVPWKDLRNKITKTVINSGATTIGDYAFYGCTNMTSISLPTTIQRIGKESFEDCDQLASVALPSGLTTIGEFCFYSSGLKDATIPNTVTEIGGYAFSSCNLLTSIVFPDNLTTIPNRAANWCNNLKEVIIGEGTEEIGESAFYYSGVTKITIPSTLTRVGDSAFGNCKELSDVYYAGTRTMANVISIGAENTYFTGTDWHFAASDRILMLPSGLKKIEPEAFSNVNAEKIIVPDSATAIQSKAFASCRSLLILELPDGNLTIADDILAGCGDVTIVCKAGSPAETWAIKNGYSVTQQLTFP